MVFNKSDFWYYVTYYNLIFIYDDSSKWKSWLTSLKDCPLFIGQSVRTGSLIGSANFIIYYFNHLFWHDVWYWWQKINVWQKMCENVTWLVVTKMWHPCNVTLVMWHQCNMTLFSDKTKKMLGLYMCATFIQKSTSNNWENTFQCLVQSNGLSCHKMRTRSDQIEDLLLLLLLLKNLLKLRAL